MATAHWWQLLRPAMTGRGRVLFRTVDPAYRLPEEVRAHWQDATDPAWAARERTGIYAGVAVYVARPERTSPLASPRPALAGLRAAA